MTYTVFVKVDDALVVLGIKAASDEVARELALEYFTKLGYEDVEISSCQEGMMPIEEIKKVGNVMDAIPPSQFSFDLGLLRSISKEDREAVEMTYKKDTSNKPEPVDDPLPPWEPSEADKLFFHKYGISFA